MESARRFGDFTAYSLLTMLSAFGWWEILFGGERGCGGPLWAAIAAWTIGGWAGVSGLQRWVADEKRRLSVA